MQFITAIFFSSFVFVLCDCNWSCRRAFGLILLIIIDRNNFKCNIQLTGIISNFILNFFDKLNWKNCFKAENPFKANLGKEFLKVIKFEPRKINTFFCFQLPKTVKVAENTLEFRISKWRFGVLITIFFSQDFSFYLRNFRNFPK